MELRFAGVRRALSPVEHLLLRLLPLPGISANLQRDYMFEPKAFGELKTAAAIVLAYDGVNPLPPTLCCLKPLCLPIDLTWFERAEKGMI
jgi:hypothetical protein